MRRAIIVFATLTISASGCSGPRTMAAFNCPPRPNFVELVDADIMAACVGDGVRIHGPALVETVIRYCSTALQDDDDDLELETPLVRKFDANLVRSQSYAIQCENAERLASDID